jgi:hypothetical protein
MAAGPQAPSGARPTMKGRSLGDLDFFWMTRTNHCNLNRKLRPVGGGPLGLRGIWRAEGRRSRGIARRRARSRRGLV